MKPTNYLIVDIKRLWIFTFPLSLSVDGRR